MKCNSSIHLQPFKYGRGGKLQDSNILKTNLLIKQKSLSRTLSSSIGSITWRNHLDSAFRPGDDARAISLSHDARTIRESSNVGHLARVGWMRRLAAPAIPEWVDRRCSLRRWRCVQVGISIRGPGRIMRGSRQIGRLLSRRL